MNIFSMYIQKQDIFRGNGYEKLENELAGYNSKVFDYNDWSISD